MNKPTSRQALEYLEKLDKLIDARFAEAVEPAENPALVKAFAQIFFRDIAPEELIKRDVTDSYGALLCNLEFIKQRKPQQIKIQAYNPAFEQQGWQSTHTIITILLGDSPFLVDSVRMALDERGLSVHQLNHPVLCLRRNGSGLLQELHDRRETDGEDSGETPEQCRNEAFMYIEVDRQSEETLLADVVADLENILRSLGMAVEDWQPMRGHMQQILDSFEHTPPPLELDEIEETLAFLRWLLADHFTFLGYCEYRRAKKGNALRPLEASGLGLLRKQSGGAAQHEEAGGSLAGLPVTADDRKKVVCILELGKASSRSTIHRPVYMDYIAIKQIDNKGKVHGEYRFLGLYTAAAYHLSILHIPPLHRKAMQILRTAGFRANSHRGKIISGILENYPRDELFQIPPDLLLQHVRGIMHLQERRQVRLFVREDEYCRFFFCLVFIPRDVYDTALRKKIQNLLLQAFAGNHVEFNITLAESAPAQAYFVVRTDPQTVPEYDTAELEAQIGEMTRTWHDILHDSLLEHCGEERGTRLFHMYREAFPLAYQDTFSPRQAVYDIEHIEDLGEAGSLGMNLYHPLEEPEHSLHLKIYHQRDHLSLSDVLPMLENMGVTVISESSYPVRATALPTVWVQEFSLRRPDDIENGSTEDLQRRFQDAFIRVWRGEIENDGFNRLVMRAQLEWREVVIFRAYCKYLRQTASNFSQAYIEQVLNASPLIVRDLLTLFHLRCDPAKNRTGNKTARIRATLAQHIEEQLDEVESLDADRILRLFLSLIQATLRTNYYQKAQNGGPKTWLSFKFDPSHVPELPEPRPQYEIFVYSPRIEGVHLRGGKVARGGLRWSDRLEDFRTEILGLVKAQMVKNAVIVPLGSKGGFVVKKPPAEGGREALLAEGTDCYRTFIRGLLDLTDNLDGDKVTPPADTTRHDDDDPYLVVAADKGTATFSDIANGVAAEYNFWLGDAFASGGSDGYDHKKMGITARGAWESVKRHFRGLGLDTQKENFTVVGIGDMSGDVFGNGMLLSPHIRLVGAFNHLHIFLDPAPNAKAAFKERERLFKLPRSSWTDYNPKLISNGGGVFSRSEKVITLTNEVRDMLGIKARKLPPNELIRAMLCAQVDLLWNGGIGTYVKASGEHHSDAGDRTNDGLRVNGNELRCRVVGEGGNLGFTQLGRIEYALNGGRINTDAIDNSGGVDCSDHEVNIKILLNAVVSAGDMTIKQRSQLLTKMTNSVAQAVLRDNYLQTQAIGFSLALAPQMLDVHRRFMRHLEQAGKLDRQLEFLPSEKQLNERRKLQQGLTSPELCVLLPYSKIVLYNELLESGIPDDPFLEHDLETYFPEPLKRYTKELRHHRLRREIIATRLTNRVVNYAGPMFIYTLNEETGLPAPQIVQAFVVAWNTFGFAQLWQGIKDLDNKIEAETQTAMILEVQRFLERCSRWFLHNRMHLPGIREGIEEFQGSVEQLRTALTGLITAEDREKIERTAERWIQAGVPEAPAHHVASLVVWLSALDIIEIAKTTGAELNYAAVVYYDLGNRLKLHTLRDQISALPRDNRWKALSRLSLRAELYRSQRELTAVVLRCCTEHGEALPPPEEHVKLWLENNQIHARRCIKILDEVSATEQPDIAMLSVALREIRVLEG